jgi:hypothetical protein
VIAKRDRSTRMKVALILSVVALVAVSQPLNFQNFGRLSPHPFNPCSLKQRMNSPTEWLCCNAPQFGGCRAPANINPMFLPPNYLPPPQFLDDVCCESTKKCCNKDTQDFMPKFVCCDATEECVVTDSKGECVAKDDMGGTTPDVMNANKIEAGGQCPIDGSLPVQIRQGEPWRCSFDENVVGFTCPDDTYCVRDNSGNANSGVCCRDTTKTDAEGLVTQIGCNKYTQCQTCVQNEDDDVEAACAWLSQGSLSNNQPRCILNCNNFPQKSCVLPSNGRMCPVNTGYTSANATEVNTGTCTRRCGYIGTGRAARINNIGNSRPEPANSSAIVVDACCTKYPGDYCCDFWGQVALHCTRGRALGDVLCGVPTMGTANSLYNPQFEPLGPYRPSPNGGSPWFQPYGQFPPYGTPFGYGPFPGTPYGPSQFGAGPQQFNPYFNNFNRGPQQFNPYRNNPQFYGPQFFPRFRSGEEGEDLTIDTKQLFFMPPPQFFPRFPPQQQRRIPNVVNINPSPFVCSCDKTCGEYQDCCSDYDEECSF